MTNAAAREVGHVRAKKTMTEPPSELDRFHQEFWQELHELGVDVQTQCDSEWFLTRKEISRRLHFDAEKFSERVEVLSIAEIRTLRATVAKLTEERDGLRKRVESLNETCAAYKEQTKELLARLVDESGRRIQPATTSNAPPVPERQDDRICVVWAEEPGVPVGLQKTEGSIVVAVGATVSHVAYYRAQRLSKSLQQFLGQESNEDLTRERDHLRAQLAERKAERDELRDQLAKLREMNDRQANTIGLLDKKVAEREAILTRERDEALTSVVVLRDALSRHQTKHIKSTFTSSPVCICCTQTYGDGCKADCEIKLALTQTAQAAAAFVASIEERVRAEERRRIVAELTSWSRRFAHVSDPNTAVEVARQFDRAIAALSTAGKEET